MKITMNVLVAISLGTCVSISGALSAAVLSPGWELADTGGIRWRLQAVDGDALCELGGVTQGGNMKTENNA